MDWYECDSGKSSICRLKAYDSGLVLAGTIGINA